MHRFVHLEKQLIHEGHEGTRSNSKTYRLIDDHQKKLNQCNAEKAEKADKIGFKVSVVLIEGLSALIGSFRIFCVQNKGFAFLVWFRLCRLGIK